MPSGGVGEGLITSVSGRCCFVIGYSPWDKHDSRLATVEGKIIHEFHVRGFIQGRDFPNDTRWARIEFVPVDFLSQRTCICTGYLCKFDTRYCITEPDTQTKFCFIFGAPTEGPKLVKYPRYWNWEKLPRALVFDSYVISQAPLDMDSILVCFSSVNFSKCFTNFSYEQGQKCMEVKVVDKKEEKSYYLYSLRCNPYHVFDPGEEVKIKIYIADQWGNVLEEELW